MQAYLCNGFLFMVKCRKGFGSVTHSFITVCIIYLFCAWASKGISSNNYTLFGPPTDCTEKKYKSFEK